MSREEGTARPKPGKVLLVDDEDAFRQALARQLSLRGYDVLDVPGGQEAIKAVRHEDPHVVVLDQKMPKMDGIATLKEIKKISPEVQVIMLTGHGSTETARITGKHDIFYYLEKPCGIDELVGVLEAAEQERVYAMARHEIPAVKRATLMQWLLGAHNSRPGMMILGVLLFCVFFFMPAPRRLMEFVSTPKAQDATSSLAGYSDFKKMKEGETISSYYSEKTGFVTKVTQPDGTVKKVPLSPGAVAHRARIMVGLLVVAALFWATGAVPVGITALLVGAAMCFLGVLPPELVAKSYAKDSVIFIFGVLAVSAAIGKTGLDRRIGLLLLGTSTSITRFLFIFTPLLAVTAGFLSEHALVAFLAPILMLVYAGALRSSGLKQDRGLVVMLMLVLTFAANVGGPGSPAAGGRNAVMLGILSDYGVKVTFGEWMKLGLPFVPVMAVVIALYFYLVFRRKIQAPSLNIAAEVRKESEKIGKMTPNEYKAAAMLLLLVVLWIAGSDRFGMGGPVMVVLVLMNVLGIIRWRDINAIHWDVVALYAAASAIGTGLAISGGALWMADSLLGLLPDQMMAGMGLCVSASLITGILTNFMSDGATVAAVGPITVPMATLAGTSPLLVGLATAFASSFANMLIIGTPNNAIVYAMAKDPETGEQLVTMKDFLIHGAAILGLSFVVLWVWVFFGYWQWV